MSTFETYYNQYFKRTYAYILSRVHNRMLAEDLVSSAWAKAHANFDSFCEEKGNFSQWIFTIARNEINMYWRLYWVKNVFSLDEVDNTNIMADKSVPQQAEEQEFQEKLLSSLQHLSTKERDLIALKFYSGLNNRQIAVITKQSESNVGTILHRAIQKMRRFMEDLYE